MDRKYWKLDEVVKLKNAIAKYKQAHGNAPIAWNYVREESNLTRFTALEVRQKYFNDSKKKYRNTTVSDPALRSATRVQGTKSVALRTKVGLDPNSSVEINRIVAAASKVRPRTAFGFEFRKYLGYEGGPDRTDALFMERLKTAINNGMLGLNWCANAQGSLLAQDWGREERRDMAKLRNADMEVEDDDDESEDISGQLRQNPSVSNRTNKAVPITLPGKSKFAKDGSSRHRVPEGLSTSLENEPVVARARVTVTEVQPLIRREPQKRNPDNTLYDDAIIGPYGVLLPTPTGYGSNHVLRNFTDNEWRKIILEIKKSGFSILSDAYSWKKLTNKAGVTCSLGGLEIQFNFCKYAIPRLEQLMSCFLDDQNADLEKEITEPSRLTDVFIFHSLKKLQWDQIMPTVRLLSNLKCISVVKTSFSIWSTHFISSVLQEKSDYFKCQPDDLKKLRDDVIQMNLQFCH